MFIRYKNITNERRIDVRTRKEFINSRVFPISMPIITEKQYSKIKKFYPSALFVISYNLIKNRERFKEILLYESNNGTRPLVFACSRGRLRSPLMCLYARSLGIRAKVLWGGIKGYLKNN